MGMIPLKHDWLTISREISNKNAMNYDYIMQSHINNLKI